VGCAYYITHIIITLEAIMTQKRIWLNNKGLESVSYDPGAASGSWPAEFRITNGEESVWFIGEVAKNLAEFILDCLEEE